MVSTSTTSTRLSSLNVLVKMSKFLRQMADPRSVGGNGQGPSTHLLETKDVTRDGGTVLSGSCRGPAGRARTAGRRPTSAPRATGAHVASGDRGGHCSLETYGERDAARPHPARPTQQLPRAPVAGPWRTSRREAPLTTLMGQEIENEATRRGNT